MAHYSTSYCSGNICSFRYSGRHTSRRSVRFITNLHLYFVIAFTTPTLIYAEFDNSLCKLLRSAFRRAADACLLFYSEGTPTGAARQSNGRNVQISAHTALKNATALARTVENTEGGFKQCVEQAGSLSNRVAAQLSMAFFQLLVKTPSKVRKLLADPSFFGPSVGSLFERDIFWSDMLRSGWPLFRMAAVIEHEIREPTSKPLAINRLYMLAEPEDCTEQQETFREVSNLYQGEGRTVKLMDIREFFRAFLKGDEEIVSGPKFLLDVIFGEFLEPDRCPAAMAVAYTTLTDALQCHWHRPRSVQTHDMLDAAIDKVQRLTIQAFASQNRTDSFEPDEISTTPTHALMTSRWPIIQFMARLDPPPSFPWPSQEGVAPVALVSWSSREAELGGLNWAEHFAAEIFGGLPNVELRPDVECADIYIFRVKVPINFGGVLIFVDGETSPEENGVRDLLSGYPASIVVGPQSAGGLSVHFAVPYASTSFASRSNHNPEALMMSRPQLSVMAAAPEHRRFAAYLAYKCWPHREHFFRLLDDAARASGLGTVDVLSRCGYSAASESDRQEARYSKSYFDDAVSLFAGYRFALVFENRISPRYITEKIVNAFLAGAVPIYWGSPFVFRLFNQHSFIYVNGFATFEDAVNHVVQVGMDPAAYQAYLDAPILQNTTDAHYLFSWHKRAPHPTFLEASHQGAASPPDFSRNTLREDLASIALEKYKAGLGGVMPAIERRPWDYVNLFESYR